MREGKGCAGEVETNKILGLRAKLRAHIPSSMPTLDLHVLPLAVSYVCLPVDTCCRLVDSVSSAIPPLFAPLLLRLSLPALRKEESGARTSHLRTFHPHSSHQSIAFHSLLGPLPVPFHPLITLSLSVLSLCALRKEEAGARTSRLRQEKEALARQQQAEEEARSNLEASLGQMRGREEQLQAQLAQAQQHGEEMRKEIGERRVALEQLRKREVELRDQHRRSR